MSVVARIGVQLLVLYAPLAMSADVELSTPKRQIVLLPPVVEILSVEEREPLELSHTDAEMIGAHIAETFVQHLGERGVEALLADPAELLPETEDTDSATLFNGIRRNDTTLIEQMTVALARQYPGSDLLQIRTRFYLDFAARFGAVWQIVGHIWDGDIPAKRMVIDARLYGHRDLNSLWQGLAQERVTPRRSAKGIELAVDRLVQQIPLESTKRNEK